MKILLSGAHLTPALAMIDYIQVNHPEDELFFAGRLYSQEALKQKAVEEVEVRKKGVHFIPVSAGKFVGGDWLGRLLTVLTFPLAVWRAYRLLRQHQIEVFLSFGSYLAVPLAVAAKLARVKLVTHEQTVTMGKANQLIARLADRVALSYEETQAYLSRTDAVVTGNPLRQAKPVQPAWLSKLEKPLVLVMGGNQGSFVINDLIAAHLPQLLERYTLVHQCGRPNQLKDSAQWLTQLREQLPPQLRQRYFIREWIEEAELFWLYEQAHFALSRAGANAVLELSHKAVPSILVPLANTHNDEQLRNAQLMQRRGGAVVIEQEFLKDDVFLTSLDYMEQQRSSMQACLRKAAQLAAAKTEQAAARIYQLLSD